MKLITRSQWGARPRGDGAATPFDPQGVAVHWEGGGWKWPWGHATCAIKMRQMQAYHMDVRGWSDIAYSFVGCPHGYVYEGRGLNRRSAANGDVDVNTLWYAVQCMWGSLSGSAPDALLTAARDAIDYCRGPGGAGNGLRGHRDLRQTDCPGDQLYRWVRAGATRPDAPIPVADGLQRVSLALLRDYCAKVETLTGEALVTREAVFAAMKAKGWISSVTPPDEYPTWVKWFRRVWQVWQQKLNAAEDLGWTDADMDGIPGEYSAKRFAALIGRDFTNP